MQDASKASHQAKMQNQKLPIKRRCKAKRLEIKRAKPKGSKLSVQGKVRKQKRKQDKDLRLGVGLGAAGLASGFAACHFESDGFGFLGGRGGAVKMGWVRVVGVECRDDGLLAAGGGRRRLIRTARACCGARDQLAG